MLKKLKKNDYNWTGKYIKEYNQMVSYYEKQLEEKNRIIDSLSIENKNLKNSIKFQGKQKQISDKDIDKIRKLKNEGKSYSYISNETGWSKATISRVINNKKNIDKPIVLKIEDNKNTLDRCFNLFSAYDKRYYYDDNNLILNIYYHDFDEAEIVRDILSLGKSVIVLEPKKIRDKVVNRILRNFDR